LHNFENNYCLISNSRNQKIKVQMVCFEKTIQSVNDLIISAPVGVDIDGSTGKLNSKTHIEVISPPDLTAKLDNHVLIIEGLLHIKIIFKNPKPCPCTDEMAIVCKEFFIPVQSVLPINECKKCNNKQCHFECEKDFLIETKSKVISTSVFGYPNNNTNLAGNQINLIIKAVLEITTYILEEKLINLSCYYSHFNR